MKKVFLVIAVAALALVAQSAFAQSLLFNRGLPSTNLSGPRISLGNGSYAGYWGSTISIADYDPSDPVAYEPANLPATTTGSQFVMPSGSAGYYVSDVRIRITHLDDPETYSGQITNDVPAFAAEYSSLWLRLGLGTSVTTLTGIKPTMTQVHFPNGMTSVPPTIRITSRSSSWTTRSI